LDRLNSPGTVGSAAGESIRAIHLIYPGFIDFEVVDAKGERCPTDDGDSLDS
jgi:hypothetical protein